MSVVDAPVDGRVEPVTRRSDGLASARAQEAPGGDHVDDRPGAIRAEVQRRGPGRPAQRLDSIGERRARRVDRRGVASSW